MKLFLTSLLISIFTSANAQFDYSIKFGLNCNYSDIKLNYFDTINPGINYDSPFLGWHIYFIGEKVFSEKFSAQSGSGYMWNAAFYKPEGEGYLKNGLLHFINIPMLVKWNAKDQFFILAGLESRFLVYNNGFFGLNFYQLAGNIGLGFKPANFTLELMYSNDFLPYSNSLIQSAGPTTGKLSAYNRNLLLSARIPVIKK